MSTNFGAVSGAAATPLFTTQSMSFTATRSYSSITGIGPGGTGGAGFGSGYAGGGGAAGQSIANGVVNIRPGDLVVVTIGAPTTPVAVGGNSGGSSGTTLVTVNGAVVQTLFGGQNGKSATSTAAGGTTGAQYATYPPLGIPSDNSAPGGGPGGTTTSPGDVWGRWNSINYPSPSPTGNGSGGSGGMSTFGSGGVAGTSPQNPANGAGGAGGNINAQGQLGGASFIQLN